MELSSQEILKGASLALDNADRIRKEASYLEEHKSPTSTFLYLIAIEECSKAFLLIGLNEKLKTSQTKRINPPSFRKLFTDHIFKQMGPFEMVKNGYSNSLAEGKNEESKKIVENIKKLEKVIEGVKRGDIQNIKHESIYLDFRKGSWLIPANNITYNNLLRDLVKDYILGVRNLLT